MKRQIKIHESAGPRAFTRMDLLAVIAMLAVLFVLLLPALAKPGLNSKSFQCLNNHRQMVNAWRLYADDNSDRIVYASDDGSGNAYATVPSGGASHVNDRFAWTWSKMDFNGANAFNYDTNADLTLRPLWPYVNKTAYYKCPADQSTVTVAGAIGGSSFQNGDVAPRIRSISMNFFLGGEGGNTSFLPSAVAVYYRIFFKTTDLTLPGSAKTFVFIDERPDDINWGNFYTDMSGYQLPSQSNPNPAQYEFSFDVPSNFHDDAVVLSYADGHAEVHRWHDAATLTPLLPNGQYLINRTSGATTFPDPFGVDVPWLQARATAPR